MKYHKEMLRDNPTNFSDGIMKINKMNERDFYDRIIFSGSVLASCTSFLTGKLELGLCEG